MKKIKNIIRIVFTMALVLSVFSCSKDDEYLKYIEGGEISYTGKIDSLEIFPGKNRVKLKGLIISDPKVNEVRVYWNTYKDSISIPINRTEGVDEVEYIIDNLAENIYNFTVRTFDDKGNTSIPVTETQEVFGNRFQESIFNRPLVSNILVNSDLEINFAEMDLSSGVIGSYIEYTNNADELITEFVEIGADGLTINDFKSGSTYRYRSAFVPSSQEVKSIDTFYTDYENVKPIPTPILKNAAVPFIATATDGGRWGNLADWITNDAAKNHGGYGGWDEWNGNIFNLESGWGSPGITNGKVYQVLNDVLPAKYQLKVTLRDTNHDIADVGGAHFVIAIGDGLPDVDNIATATEVIGTKRVLVTSSLNYVVDFTVDQISDISVGLASTQADGDPGRFCNIISWEIAVVLE
ncbi:DUF4998 domain-containing protein [Wenyingzhuangia sp. IMCC45467]